MLDVDQLLQPGSGGDPESVPAYLELEAAYTEAKAKLEAREPAGESLRSIVKLSTSLLGVGKHLEVVVRLAEAATHVGGFPGCRDALKLTLGLVEQYWTGGEGGDGTSDSGATNILPPLFEPDEEGQAPDPMARCNRLLALRDAERMGRAIRAAPLVSSRGGGEVTLRMALAADGQLALPGDETAPAPDVVRSAFQAALGEDSSAITITLAAVREARQLVSSLQTLLDEKTGGQAPDFSPLDGWLRPAEGYLAPLVGEKASDDPDDDADQPSSGRGNGRISSRVEAQRAIEDVVGWFENNDPSSPVRELLMYAARLVNMHFFDWQDELADDDRLMEKLRKIRNPQAGDGR